MVMGRVRLAGEGGASAPSERPELPHGFVTKYTWKVPATQIALVGWRVMVYFAVDNVWVDGVVTNYNPDLPEPYDVFFESDHVWEAVDVPDPTIVFAKGKTHEWRVPVLPSMIRRETLAPWGDDEV